MKGKRRSVLWSLLLCRLCHADGSRSNNLTNNIFLRVPPPPIENFFSTNEASPIRSSSNNGTLLNPETSNISSSSCEQREDKILPALNVSCSTFLDQDTTTTSTFPSPLVAFLYDTLDIHSYCDECSNTHKDSHSPVVTEAQCGTLCEDHQTVHTNRLLDPTSGLTCGDVAALAPFWNPLNYYCPIIILAAMTPLCCATTTTTIPVSFLLSNITTVDNNDLEGIELAFQEFVEAITSSNHNNNGGDLVDQSASIHSLQETECSSLELGRTPCFRLVAEYEVTLLRDSTEEEEDDDDLVESSNDPNVFQPFVDAQFGNDTWVVLEAAWNFDELQDDDRIIECDFCDGNQSQPFWLPLVQFTTEKVTELCANLKSIYPQKSSTDCSLYDTAVHQNLLERVQSHLLWAFPVNLQSLCDCSNTVVALPPHPAFCPSGMQVPSSSANTTTGAGLTCGVLDALTPHLMDATTVVWENIQQFIPLCCEKKRPPPPAGAGLDQVKTSIVAADLTTVSDLANLQAAFGWMVEDLVSPLQRLRRRRLLVQLDSTSPRLYNLQNVTCPTFWISSDNCQTVNASYNLFVVDKEDTSQYVNLTNEAIDEGLLYQRLRQIHPATDVAILGTPVTAFAAPGMAVEDKEEEDDGDNSSTTVRAVAFFLGLVLGLTLTCICMAIGQRIANIFRIEQEKKQRLLSNEEEEIEDLHPVQTDTLETTPEDRPLLAPNDRQPEGALISPTQPMDSPRSTEEEKQPMVDEAEADISLAQMVESPEANADPETLVYGGSYSSDSPRDGSIVAKALFQRGEELFEDDIESELMQMMEQAKDDTSAVDSDTHSTRSIDLNLENPPQTPDGTAAATSDNIRSNEDDAHHPERITPLSDIKCETIVSGEFEDEPSSILQKSESELEGKMTGSEESEEGILFETLAMGGFGTQDGDVSMEVTSVSSSSSAGDERHQQEQQQEEVASGSFSSGEDIARDLVFQGQAGHFGFGE